MRLIAVLFFLYAVPLQLSAQIDTTGTQADTSDAPNGIYIGRGGARIGAGVGFSFKQPSLELAYGTSNFQSAAVTTPVQATGSIQISSGTIVVKQLMKTRQVARSDYDRLYVQLYNTDYLGAQDSTMTHLHGWRFGLHLSSGYSYLRPDSTASLTLLHTGGPLWSYNTFAFGTTKGADSSDAAIFNNLASYHFGSHTGFMIRYNMTSALSLNAEFERTMMFRDYSFFGWVGSILTEGIAQGLLTGNVIHSIEQKSPLSAPIANVVLRTALSFGLYELRRSHQHFPFGGNAPMFMDAVRIGLTVSF